MRNENKIRISKMEKKNQNTQEKEKKKTITVRNFLIKCFTHFN